jgi:hypothetical protein
MRLFAKEISRIRERAAVMLPPPDTMKAMYQLVNCVLYGMWPMPERGLTSAV